MTETPQIIASNYNANIWTGDPIEWGDTTCTPIRRISPGFTQHDLSQQFAQLQQISTVQQQCAMPNPSRRIVQVFIADPNENVPLAKAVLYTGTQHLTDLTDNELFFEVPISELLKAFNTERVTWTDKEASKKAGKDIFLDPVKIRDLKMVVVTIAQF